MTEASKQPSFEESLKRLEEIVLLLDGGKSDLETSLAHYEEGVKLLRHCRVTLSDAEQRIEILKKIDDATGELVIDALDPNSLRSDESIPGRQNDAPTKPKRTRSTGTKKKGLSKEEKPLPAENELNDAPFNPHEDETQGEISASDAIRNSVELDAELKSKNNLFDFEDESLDQWRNS